MSKSGVGVIFLVNIWSSHYFPTDNSQVLRLCLCPINLCCPFWKATANFIDICSIFEPWDQLNQQYQNSKDHPVKGILQWTYFK